ncbi:hypothetical protein BDV96DRAFT_654173 [Lophiotrema nucula]|uniref:Uncharacterized protein n=1 Tax=Lophiotrema nucula TaxID=690887 RepID=A0A6A5YJ58_9PLEO|nr:hypothetical protein BDV96DRAFT_654173 [Lophiotrema nucula]
MHLSLSSTLTTLAIASLATTSSAFVMDVYDSNDCSGDARNVNVWDNTCATWMGGFKSYIPRVYGGTHQYAYFFAPSNCGSLPGSIGGDWADGGGFKVGQCYYFGDGNTVANAAASYSS